MKAGAATIDITPKMGTHLLSRPATAVLDPLCAKAVVFESGGKKICFLSLDVVIITRTYSDQIRDAAARLGFDRAAVMVHATQTHAAPSVGNFMIDDEIPVPADRAFVRGGDLEYSAFASERAIEAIAKANERLEDVEIASNSGVLDGLSFNRRGVMRDGKVGMPGLFTGLAQPLGATNIRYLEGPTDPEVGVVCARSRASGKIVAMLLHHTCHPVDVFVANLLGIRPGADVSADWPGAWAAQVRTLHGEQCVPLVLNGCCGNINPWPPFTPDYSPDHRRMGHSLAAMSEKILASLTFQEGRSPVIDWKVKHISLPLREIDPNELRGAQEYLHRHPEPPWKSDGPREVELKWSQAAWLWSIELMRRRSPALDYEIQVFRLGDAAFVSLPGEPFVEGQLAIKIDSPAFPTYVVHCTTQYVAYIPTREAYPRGGHEVFFCKVAPGALDTIVAEASGLLRAVF